MRTRAGWPWGEVAMVMVCRLLNDALMAVGLTPRRRRKMRGVPVDGTAAMGPGASLGGRPEARAEGPAYGRHVLLLDDEEAILLPTAKYFRGLGWTVDVAQEAEEGEALISHRHYDLAILDVRVTRFGGTGGLELLREIRRRDHRTSVIVLSAYISPEVDAEARDLGAAAVLRKPQSLPDLAHLALTLMEGLRG
ncbi:MAG TPA: response regulator [Vicinamibacteria bacterium]|nr:response regulator [Vicinamibacteria bacterium]